MMSNPNNPIQGAANPGKRLIRMVDGVRYLRIPVKTHLITAADSLAEVALRYAKPRLERGDILFISEKAAACAQGRAIPMEEIKPRRLAVFLSRYVTKTSAGIGLGIPETMEIALRECGVLRILFAALCGAVGRALGRRGWFYVVAGPKARGIDGPTKGTIPPYNHCVVPAPADPKGLAEELAGVLETPVAIVDINDLGANILGASRGAPPKARLSEILRDNPLGQGEESTPMGIIRRLAD